ncbi:initiation factor 2B related [Chlorella sorokiniana]|uniref:Initiation factor 2B related n=1 Tax=Chlorella sorokiniana TaxID=3076 RepID=A0A2P6TDC7_CHLSO|nr:initiation factor 2B related [Chlorella sorokiniana]|eukprot:PRW20650.1 initiation factor 2B related [Chlorella sorokiniana]
MAAAAADPPAAAPVRRKQVVTAFIQRPADGNVLVVLRSDKVGTYKRYWGAVSGGVEPGDRSLVERCRQEILEEVGFAADQVQLVHSGRPLIVDDGRLHFNIHPFLFRLNQGDAKVQLNWENIDTSWVPPAGVRQLRAVPLLAETLERLLLEDDSAIKYLAEDRQHGAAELAVYAVQALAQEADRLARQAAASSSTETEGAGAAALEAIRNFGWHLACCRPQMVPIANSVAAVLASAHDDLRSRADAFAVPLGEVCGVVQQHAAAEQRRLAGAAAQLRQQVLGLLRDGMTLMTCSLSSTVLAAVKEAAAGGMKLRAIVCESRPLCEGVTLAAQWAEAGVDVVLITDAQAALFVGQADLVLVGADAITEAAAVNKAGSHLLALAAHAAGMPVYVAADTSKLSPGPLASIAFPGQQQEEQEEEPAAEEVTAAWGRPLPAGVRVRNLYFEPVPLSLLTGLVTEQGRLEPAAIAAAVQERQQQYRTSFQLP